MHPCVSREPLAAQEDGSAPQTQAGTPTGRVCEESDNLMHGRHQQRQGGNAEEAIV